MGTKKRSKAPDMFAEAGQRRTAREAPLAARMRPRTLDELLGQEHLVGPGRVLRKAIEADQVPSIILWGPPGSGKTTLARIIAGLTQSHFAPVSAVAAGVADLRRIVDEAQERRSLYGQRTILFIDEIHRFNKAQQDAVLPYVEDGVVTLIGATTENPSFEVIGPLLSRCRVFTLNPLTPEQIEVILRRALADGERGVLASLQPVRPEPALSEAEGPVEGRTPPVARPSTGSGRAERVEIDDDTIRALAQAVGGDARIALNALELAATTAKPDADGRRRLALADIEEALQHRAALYDKAGDYHYDTISAFIKSLRGSDPDAALYWLARMLEGGEDPLFIARRMVILASEDVGLADPQALVVAMAAQQAIHFVGLPEGFYPLAEAAIYLASAPKSNSVGSAYMRALKDAKATLNEPVPLHLRNPATPMMEKMGYGRDYRYDHAFPEHYAGQEHLPKKLAGRRYYLPGDQGFEKRIAEWMQRLGQRAREKQEEAEP